ncbi:FecR family protein [Zobellia nedashkovskayae]|uniref:FecR family protein n=1 Tax=Zobellia nedashkovskayae TaxID=2779510 RepID=UPI00188AB413|nr:FecR family protein [Zobellia nedashkovskayae]
MSEHLKHNNLIARWMDGRLNNEEKEQLNKSGELDALKTVLNDIDTWKVSPFDRDAGLADLQKKNKGTVPIKKPKDKGWMRIAAGIVILLSCSLAWYFISNTGTTVTTEIAENKKIELPKGSFVELDAASRITYNEEDWEKKRELTLSGQAFFDVTSGVPFSVNTSSAKVSVLGTRFNIKTAKELFSVICYEGKVEVTYKSKSQIITMGQSVILENDSIIKLEHQQTAPDWINGINTYNKTPLLEVVLDVQRYYDVDIDLPEAYKKLQFTGTIEHKDLKHTLNTIFTTMEIEYTLQTNGNVTFD